MAQEILGDTVFYRVNRVATRLGMTMDEVVEYAEQFKNLPINSVLDYIERRTPRLRGDEQVIYELQEVRKDLAMLSSLSIADFRAAFETGRQKASKNS